MTRRSRLQHGQLLLSDSLVTRALPPSAASRSVLTPPLHCHRSKQNKVSDGETAAKAPTEATSVQLAKQELEGANSVEGVEAELLRVRRLQLVVMVVLSVSVFDALQQSSCSVENASGICSFSIAQTVALTDQGVGWF